MLLSGPFVAKASCLYPKRTLVPPYLRAIQVSRTLLGRIVKQG